MASPSSRSLLDFGTFQLGKVALQANNLVAFFSSTKKKIGYFADDGGGFLTSAMSVHLVTHLQKAIENQGAGVPGYSPIGYSATYAEWKARTVGHLKMYYLSGMLKDSIKVLNRRYGSGGATRGAVVGIDQRQMAGDYRSSSGRMYNVAAAAYDIEFGRRSGKPRMLLTYATQDFLNQYGPPVAKGFFSRFMQDAKTQMIAAVNVGSISQADQFASGLTPTREGADPMAQHKRKEGLDIKYQYFLAMRQQGVSADVVAEWWIKMRGVTNTNEQTDWSSLNTNTDSDWLSQNNR